MKKMPPAAVGIMPPDPVTEEGKIIVVTGRRLLVTRPLKK
jgi:hypothetical protein